ncbi:hypothetical protein R5R35_005682 [Gryllus longicercus]|uniref:Protein DEK n=1 Tax=Gryllus longicercus TaxID=2509291 RepID=A0AAN9Z8S2_9ORTH
MSTDKKNAENGDMEVEETSNDETSDTKPATNADASEESLKSKDKDSKKKLKGKDVKKESKAANAKSAKEGKAGKVKDEDSKSEEEDEDDDEDDEKGDGKVPLLDQPLELSGTRERKKVNRFSEEYKTGPKDSAPLEIPEGSGTLLGSIPRIESNLQRSKLDSLKPLHKLLFNRAGRASLLKKNIRKFNGFDFDKDSDQFAKKKQTLLKYDMKSLKELCSIMDLKISLKRDELVETLMNFLLKPEDSGKGANIKPRPKRTARANNKTYSESDDEQEERKSSRRGKKKLASLKEASSEDDDEDDEKDKADKKDADEDEDNASDDGKKEKDDKENDSVEDAKENDSEDDDDDDDDAKDQESDDSEETSSKSKKGGRAGKNNKKQAAKKPKPATKKAEKKQSLKKKAKSDEESSADEPSTKKLKAPPTDEEIKSYVKQILEGANLEETTMKIVCKQVYAHYPEFDLAHKKDFIKTTVKSLIST